VISGKKVVVVCPAYKAALTLERTYSELPHAIVDEVLLVDDASTDETVRLALRLGIRTFVHERNRGYGANQKTCYYEALKSDADIVVMLHPDYQYDPRLVTSMAAMISSGIYDVVLGSRILGNTALRGGMPLYKYVANRFLTFAENLLLGSKLSEFHSGYRAYSRKALETIPMLANSNDFVFDNQLLVQAVALGLEIGEISCPTKYFPEASSIGWRRSLQYGMGVLATGLQFRLWRWGILAPRILTRDPSFLLLSQADHLRPGYREAVSP